MGFLKKLVNLIKLGIKQQTTKTNKGLTLVELSVVIMILGILMSVIYVNVGDTKNKMVGKLNKVKLKTNKSKIACIGVQSSKKCYKNANYTRSSQ